MMMENYMFSKKNITDLIVPLIIEQTLAFTVGMIDTIMVAGVGEHAVSGVALVDTISVLIISLLAALATGGAVVAGQYLGLKEPGNARHAAKQLVIAATMFAVLVMVLCLIFNEQLLSLLFGNIDSAVMAQSRTYFYMTALSYPFIAMLNSGAALFRGMGNSKIAMINALIMNLVNVGGNSLFIYGFNWGVFGAALATLISRIVAATSILIMLRKPSLVIHVRGYRLKDIDFKMIRRILKIGLPNGLENSMFQIGKIIVTSLVAVGGTAAIAAHAVGNSLALVGIIPGQAMSLAILAVVSQCIGAKEYGQAEFYTKYLLKRAYFLLLILNMGMLVFLRPILGIYQLSEGTMEMAVQIMILHSIAAVVIWPLSFTLPNALRAAGDVKYTMIVSIISMWAFRILLSYLFVYQFGWGLLSIWAAMVVDWAFRSILFTGRWRGGKWKNFSVV